MGEALELSPTTGDLELTPAELDEMDCFSELDPTKPAAASSADLLGKNDGGSGARLPYLPTGASWRKLPSGLVLEIAAEHQGTALTLHACYTTHNDCNDAPTGAV